MLAGPARRARLERSGGSEERALHVLRALGLSGALDMVAPLLERLGAKSALEAKVAAQAVVAITGLDLRKDEFAGPEAPEPPDSLPPLEEDDLDADLVPKPEEELPSPNAGAIRAWWASRKAALHPGQRHVLGVPRTPESLFEALESGPLGLREGRATALHFLERRGALARLRRRSRQCSERTFRGREGRSRMAQARPRRRILSVAKVRRRLGFGAAAPIERRPALPAPSGLKMLLQRSLGGFAMWVLDNKTPLWS